jgi:HAD superfamily hydrolase (TIGR01450 family)
MSERLLDAYDAILLDLDGTVFKGTEAIPGAPQTIQQLRDASKAVRFVTNNASRSPKEVAGHLAELGIPVTPAEVRTSAQAAAAVLKERLEPDAGVLVVGTEALADEVRHVGLRPLRQASDDVQAVVQGLSKEVGWPELSEAVLAVRAGALWVACNDDLTLPTERGEVIGNGALVAAVAAATNARPVVAGKPNRPLMDQAAAGAGKSLVVGDRLDTDIAGAEAAELDALMVLSGVSTPRDLLESGYRPRYLAWDVTALVQPAEELEVAPTPDWMVGNGAVRWAGTNRPDPIGLLRALCAAQVTTPKPGDDAARAALTELGLTDRLA